MTQSVRQRPKRRHRWLIVALLVPLLLAYGYYYFQYVGPEWANQLHCANQVQQIGLAIHNYAMHRCFPPAYTVDANGRRLHSWRTLILPHLVYDDKHKEIRFDEPWDSPHNRSILETMRNAYWYYRCFDATGPKGETSFAMVVGPNTISDGSHSAGWGDIKDGASNTILFVETKNSGIYWAEPRDLDFGDMSFRVNDPSRPGIGSNHSGGAFVVFADGTLRFVTDDVDPKIVEALTTINGGEDVSGYMNKR
jgi:hypothetical protein